MLNKVSDTIKEFDMIKKGERLLVCLSGGADSVSLLLCLKKLGYDICACHVNHQLRGQESERDQAFCEKLCSDLGVELFVHRIDVTSYCRDNSVSVEEGARDLRYGVFSTIDADKICTAHSLSDCIETTVFNLARGTGLKGLCSIPPKRDNIIRPLINCTREEILAFLESEGQDYVTDSTNLTDEYTRNRIRHNIVPQLKKINASLMKSYANTLEHLRKDMIYLENTAKKAYSQCCDNDAIIVCEFNTHDDCIKDRILMMWLADRGVKVSHEKLPLVYDVIRTDGKLNIAKDSYIVCKDGKLYYDVGSIKQPSNSEPVLLTGNGDFFYCGRKITVKLLKMEDIDCDIANVHKMFANCCMDYDKIKNGLVLHKYTDGDRIHLVNRDTDYSIRKLLKNNLPCEKRAAAIVLYDDDGAVFVEGSGAAERVRITDKTQRLLTFIVSDII